MRGGLGGFLGIGFMDLFTYFDNDLDKVLSLFVPLIRRWYEDDSVALKVCTTVDFTSSVHRKGFFRVQPPVFPFFLLMLLPFQKKWSEFSELK